MKYLDVQLRLPDELLHPMSAFIRSGDTVRYEELLTWTVLPEEGVEYELFYAEAELPAYRDAIEDVESIVEYELAPIDDTSAHVWVCEETRPEVRAWRAAFQGRSLVVVPPIRFDEEAVMSMTMVGDGQAIQQVLAEMPGGIDVTVNEIGTYDRRGGTLAGGLTDRQLAAVRTALELGYYEVPRESSLADVASALDCAESSASEMIRRAERTVLSRVLDRYGGSVGRADPRTTPGR